MDFQPRFSVSLKGRMSHFPAYRRPRRAVCSGRVEWRERAEGDGNRGGVRGAGGGVAAGTGWGGGHGTGRPERSGRKGGAGVHGFFERPDGGDHAAGVPHPVPPDEDDPARVDPGAAHHDLPRAERADVRAGGVGRGGKCGFDPGATLVRGGSAVRRTAFQGAATVPGCRADFPVRPAARPGATGAIQPDTGFPRRAPDALTEPGEVRAVPHAVLVAVRHVPGGQPVPRPGGAAQHRLGRTGGRGVAPAGRAAGLCRGTTRAGAATGRAIRVRHAGRAPDRTGTAG